MKAAVYHDTADIRIETVPDPALAPKELILEVHAAGICGTDVAIDPGVEGFEIGQVVASGAGISCGACDPCVAGRTNLCLHYATVGLERASSRTASWPWRNAEAAA